MRVWQGAEAGPEEPACPSRHRAEGQLWSCGPRTGLNRIKTPESLCFSTVDPGKRVVLRAQALLSCSKLQNMENTRIWDTQNPLFFFMPYAMFQTYEKYTG